MILNPDQKTVILISGKWGTGKTTLANFLIKEFVRKKKKIKKTSFAAVLKEKIKPAIEFIDEITNKKNSKESIRPLFQSFGQTVRAIDKDSWVRYVENKIRNEKEAKIFIIDDWRFENEFHYFKDREYNVLTVRINELKPKIETKDNDVSETSLDYFDKFDIVVSKFGKFSDVFIFLFNTLNFATFY